MDNWTLSIFDALSPCLRDVVGKFSRGSRHWVPRTHGVFDLALLHGLLTRFVPWLNRTARCPIFYHHADADFGVVFDFVASRDGCL